MAYCLNFISKLLDIIGLLTFMPLIGELYGSENNLFLTNLNLEFLTKYVVNNSAYFYLKIIFVIFLLKHIILIVSKYLTLKIEKKIYLDVSVSLLEIFTFFPYKKFNNFKQSSLIQYVLSESSNLVKLSSTLIAIIFESLFLIILVLFFILKSDSQILISLVFISFILFLFVNLFKKKLKLIGHKKIFFGKKLYSNLISILNLYRESTFFRKKIFLNNKFYSLANASQSNKNAISFIKFLPHSVFEISIIIFLIFYFIINLSNTINNTLVLDKLILMSIILYRLYPTYTNLQNNINNVLVYKRCLDELYIYFLKVKFFLAKKTKVKKKLDKKTYKEIKNIEFKNVKIFYHKKSISIPNFNAKKGQIILVKGKSGSGKSTLSYLAGGLILPNNGRIEINNEIIINNYESMRSFGNVGYCPQNIYLFEDTIKNNILFLSKNKFDLKKYEKSIDIAQCKSLLKTSINKLSGGEKLRIGIARAIYNSGDLLILDEPTSSLDKKTAKNFVKKLNKIKKDKLIIFISHQDEKFLDYDEVVNFDK